MAHITRTRCPRVLGCKCCGALLHAAVEAETDQTLYHCRNVALWGWGMLWSPVWRVICTVHRGSSVHVAGDKEYSTSYGAATAAAAAANVVNLHYGGLYCGL